MLRPLSLAFPSLLLMFTVALSSPACDDDELEGDGWSYTMTGDEVTIASHPTKTTGKTVVTSWRAELGAGKDAYGEFLDLYLRGNETKAPDGSTLYSTGTLKLGLHGKLAPQTFTTYRVLTNSEGGPPKEGLKVELDDFNQGKPASRAEGAIAFENIELERRGNGEARLRVRVRFEDVKFTTVLESGRESTSVMSGTLDVTGVDIPPPPPTNSSSSGGSSSGGSSSGGSSSGGANCGTEVWTCPYDGQATPTCQYACTFPAGSTERKQSCDVLASMLESGDPSACCGKICP